MTQLEHLYLGRSSYLPEAEFEKLSCLTNLKVLCIFDNIEEASGAKVFEGKLTFAFKLVFFNLLKNTLAALSGLSNLIGLSLYGTKSCWPIICRLTNLEVLHLDSDVPPSEVHQFSSLTKVKKQK